MKVWKPEDDELLMELAKQGIGSVAIAEILGRTGNAVRQRACYLGISIIPRPDHKRWTRQADKRLKSLVQANEPIEVISKKLGRPIHSVYNRCKTLKLNVSISRHTENDLLTSCQSFIDKQDAGMWGSISTKALRLPFRDFPKLFMEGSHA
jgi:hypothetical protein